MLHGEVSLAWILLQLVVGPSFASPAARSDKLTEKAHAALSDDPLKAYKLAGKAIEADPMNAEAHFVRGSAGITIAGRLNDQRVAGMAITLAREDLKFVVSHSDEAFDVGLARTLLSLGTRAPVLEDPTAECSSEATLAFNVAEAALGRGDFATARGAYQDAVDGCPGNAQWWAYYGDAWFNSGDYAIAQEMHNRALLIEPCYWSALRFRGDARIRDGHVVEGMNDAITAVACNPGYEIGWGYVQAALEALDARMLREPVDRPEPADVATSDLPTVWTAYFAARDGSASDDPMERERSAIRAGVTTWQALSGPPPSPLWAAMAAADTEGRLDAAIYTWLLDMDLRDGFLAYRKDHLAELVDYIRSDLVVFPGREN